MGIKILLLLWIQLKKIGCISIKKILYLFSTIDENKQVNFKTMRFAKEFKEFITKGNIIDLAVAVVIGSAFGAIVSSLVNDVITPLLLTPALEAAHVQNLDKLTWGAVKYGNFIAAVIQFTIISLALFITVKAMNALIKKKQAALPSPGPSTTDQLLMEIRDALKK
jgi:large conductance mechanosensitive channel